MSDTALYLASRSPRRQELLRQIGLRFQAQEVEVAETPLPGESPEEFVHRLALEKARAGWRAPSRRLSVPVLGADTAVVVDGEILGKPLDCPDAVRMLGKLSDRSHRVLSAVALVWEGRQDWRLNESRVWFRTLTESERERYCATGEPLDKAGAYAIQGRGAMFVSRLEGSYSGVMGLPVYETAGLLDAFGIPMLGEAP
jgi:septum formation protein